MILTESQAIKLLMIAHDSCIWLGSKGFALTQEERRQLVQEIIDQQPKNMGTYMPLVQEKNP